MTKIKEHMTEKEVKDVLKDSLKMEPEAKRDKLISLMRRNPRVNQKVKKSINKAMKALNNKMPMEDLENQEQFTMIQLSMPSDLLYNAVRKWIACDKLHSFSFVFEEQIVNRLLDNYRPTADDIKVFKEKSMFMLEMVQIAIPTRVLYKLMRMAREISCDLGVEVNGNDIINCMFMTKADKDSFYELLAG